MIDAGSIAALLGSLKTAGDIAKGLIELKSIAEIQGKVIELQRIILTAHESALSAQASQAVLLEEKRKLETKLAQIEDWKDEANRYELTDYGGGTFAYKLKSGMENGEPIHAICPECYQKRHKSILQTIGFNNWNQKIVHCISCNNKVALGEINLNDCGF